MNIFLLSPDERLKNWRDFRRNLTNDLSETEHIDLILRYWSTCPLEQPMILDPYDCKNWMTPWEIINYGKFCQNTVGFMMEQSLLLSNSDYWNSERVQLYLIKDLKLSEIMLTVLIDSKILLNYNYNSIVEYKNIKENIIILGKYKYDPDKKIHIEY